LKLNQADKKFVWHPYTQMKDWREFDNKVIVRGRGFYLIDDSGKKYLDGIASMWCNVWGHGQNEIVHRMTQQLQKLQHSTLFGLANGPSIELAKKILNIAKGMDKVFYSDNGSTAIEVAMKMALQYWRNKGKYEKKYFISLKHAYHGDTIGCMSVGHIAKYFTPYKPLLFDTYTVPTPFFYESKYSNYSLFEKDCIEKTENTIKRQAANCAALVMESGAQIAGGVIIYPKGYQKKISELCKKYDILLILDEIATGFGRLGNMVEYIYQKSIPDIVCFGKALTAGYFPLAVTLTSKRIYDEFLGEYFEDKQLFHGHTFTGHPVGCAAALENINLYSTRHLIQKINANSRYLKKRLDELPKLSIVSDIRHKGLLAGIELAKNGKPIQILKDKTKVNYFIMNESVKMGVFLRSLGNIMIIIPPLAIDRNALEIVLDTQFKLLQKIEKNV
jgi:adenosylmethionine---8-amino-7-oxononanoate aminotransferase